MYDHLDLFSGIGGFALAARWAGFETVQFVEIDPFCQRVLQKNFKGVPIHDDIKTFTYAHSTSTARLAELSGCLPSKEGEIWNGTCDSDTSPRPFLLTGGFPCQPFSCAGKRRGKEDDRFLWPEMLRVVSEAKPHYVIGENVGGFINMGLDDCISDLEAEGYEVQAFVIPACAVGAPHRRDRVWIVANLRSDGFDQGSSPLPGQESGRAFPCDTDHHAPHSQDERLQRRGDGSERVNEESDGLLSAGSIINARWSEPWLEVATRLCRVDDGLPRQVDRVNRLKALGNAIVPQVAYEIMKAIMETKSV